MSKSREFEVGFHRPVRTLKGFSFVVLSIFGRGFKPFKKVCANNRLSHNELSHVGASSDFVGVVQKVSELVQIL